MSIAKLESLLLVVDNWELGERYEEQLSSRFEVTCAPFAQTGLEIIAESPQLFSHLVVDLSVESITPIEFLNELRKLPTFESIQIWVIDEQAEPGPLRNLLKDTDQILNRPVRFDSLFRSNRQ